MKITVVLPDHCLDTVAQLKNCAVSEVLQSVQHLVQQVQTDELEAVELLLTLIELVETPRETTF